MMTPGKPDYYQILGHISPDATQEDIKRMYKQLSLKLHPDKNPRPDATMQFQNLQEAYSILSDPEQRKQYNDYYYNYEEEDKEVENEDEQQEFISPYKGFSSSKKSKARITKKN